MNDDNDNGPMVPTLMDDDDNDNEPMAPALSDEKLIEQTGSWTVDEKTGRPSMAPMADPVWYSLAVAHPEVAVEVARAFLGLPKECFEGGKVGVAAQRAFKPLEGKSGIADTVLSFPRPDGRRAVADIEVSLGNKPLDQLLDQLIGYLGFITNAYREKDGRVPDRHALALVKTGAAARRIESRRLNRLHGRDTRLTVVNVTKRQSTKERDDICHDLLQTDPNKMHNSIIRNAYIDCMNEKRKEELMTAYDKYQRDIGRQENQIQVALEILREGFDVEMASRISKLEPDFIREEEHKAKARKAS